MHNSITRRQAVLSLGITTSAVLTPAQVFSATPPATIRALLPSASACVLTPQAVEGPYYFDPKLLRNDITDNKPGVPLRILLQVVDAGTCAPLAGARADIWHADAIGEYSGYVEQGDDQKTSTKGQTFLRGTQIADIRGEVAFDTVYPGWYRGRTPHIHFKIFLDEKMFVTGQIYFPDALSEFIFANVAPYKNRTKLRDTTNAADGVLQESGGGHETFCNIKEDRDRYVASLIVGVDRTATVKGTQGPNRDGPPRGPPPGIAGNGPARAPIDASKLVPGTSKTE
jgi:protocatechuate 3,4-dioxygenase beta subunit